MLQLIPCSPDLSKLSHNTIPITVVKILFLNVTGCPIGGGDIKTLYFQSKILHQAHPERVYHTSPTHVVSSPS